MWSSSDAHAMSRAAVQRSMLTSISVRNLSCFSPDTGDRGESKYDVTAAKRQKHIYSIDLRECGKSLVLSVRYIYIVSGTSQMWEHSYLMTYHDNKWDFVAPNLW